MDEFDNLSDGRKSLVPRSRARSRGTVVTNPPSERLVSSTVETGTFENDLGRWSFRRIPEMPATPDHPPYREK